MNDAPVLLQATGLTKDFTTRGDGAFRARTTRFRAVDEVGAKYEGNLGLDLGLDQAVHRDRLAAGEVHIGVQNTEVGLIDAELLLDCHRGQADLAAHNDGTGIATDFVDAALHGVCGNKVFTSDQIPHGCAGHAGCGGGREAIRGSGDVGLARCTGVRGLAHDPYFPGLHPTTPG